MKKYILDLTVSEVCRINDKYVLVKLTHDEKLPPMIPGQFVEVRVDDSPTTFLRRPISVNFVDIERNELWLLVAAIGDGTRRIAMLKKGDMLNCILPLGRGFTMPESPDDKALLVGGGVGVAPLLYMGMAMREQGMEPTFLLGARRAADLLLLDEFRKYGRVMITTEDGSEGERGFVTNHSILSAERFNFIFTCGPKPMMLAVARYASKAGIACEVSLENCMACGVGACLCCVEDTTEGNVCVCTEGPVFDIKQLKWDL
ncbi:MAG: dihydroorotate dehydrogenase electron transfer subunit [Prevotella sp.]|uniref:dihydroorotate dehydrogenase electron transfer subunit n=1 Tax=Prevotella sp. TaxID=59823 RepID=UPI002A29B088|nr:dihydroorotate dehydrogenase electron transfer subunit [Prevotella sp.]MDD7317614.1 dihydroorotate dehydrogenase electron transfer subunit [Prevotellaceae bacterium]MDY4020539.1 dihydroorotate dehydrogenase electron transfer subunit [Prevotella sp.]